MHGSLDGILDGISAVAIRKVDRLTVHLEGQGAIETIGVAGIAYPAIESNLGLIIPRTATSGLPETVAALNSPLVPGATTL